MNFDVKKQAKIHFDNVFSLIETLLENNECLDFKNLKELYLKLKKKEQQKDYLTSLPLIGKMINNKSLNDNVTSENILKVVSLMKRCKLGYIDKTFFIFLKSHKEGFYNLYFKEIYEGEVKVLNQQNIACDALFNNKH